MYFAALFIFIKAHIACGCMTYAEEVIPSMALDDNTGTWLRCAALVLYQEYTFLQILNPIYTPTLEFFI